MSPSKHWVEVDRKIHFLTSPWAYESILFYCGGCGEVWARLYNGRRWLAYNRPCAKCPPSGLPEQTARGSLITFPPDLEKVMPREIWDRELQLELKELECRLHNQPPHHPPSEDSTSF